MGTGRGGLRHTVLPIYGKTKCRMKEEDLSPEAFALIHK
jgi:hypothetical protein